MVKNYDDKTKQITVVSEHSHHRPKIRLHFYVTEISGCKYKNTMCQFFGSGLWLDYWVSRMITVQVKHGVRRGCAFRDRFNKLSALLNYYKYLIAQFRSF